MSDQDMEMQFADPEWQPASTRQRRYNPEQPPYVPAGVNDSPRQQSDGPQDTYDRDKAGNDGEYSQGYRADSSRYHYQEPAQTPLPHQRVRRRHPWFWILAVIIVIVLLANPVGEDVIAVFWRVFLALAIIGGLFALVRAISRSRSSVSSVETHTFSVEMQPKIMIKNDVGSIRVHPGGEEYQVVVQATKRKRILLGGEIDVQYDQNTKKNSITVKAANGWSFIGSKWVDFDITVPRNADLELKNDAGSITVSGVNGQMTCLTDAGTVKVTDTLLLGNSKLKTDAGTITFSGALDPRGSYQMTTDAGTVSVTLPPNASFRLDAKTDVGSINSDFPIHTRRDFPGGKARCDIGTPPYPSLKLRTDVGTINIRQSTD